MRDTKPKSNHVVPHYNGRVFRGVNLYLSNRYGSKTLRNACTHIGMPLEYLLKDNTWVSNEFLNDLMKVLIEETGDADILENAGKVSSAPEVLNPIEFLLLASYPAPYLFFRTLPIQFAKFNLYNQLEVLKCSFGYCKVRMLPKNGIAAHPGVCQNTKGMLAATKTFFGLDELTVEHTQCLHEGHTSCEYEIIYKANSYWKKRAATLAIITSILLITGFTVSKVLTPYFTNREVLQYFSYGLGILFATSVNMFLRHLRLLNYISSYLEQSSETAMRLQEERSEAELKFIRVQLAEQMAHDIRSPLSAIQVALSLDDSEKSKRDLVDLALKRIGDLVESVSASNHDIIESIDPIVEFSALIAEKKLEILKLGKKITINLYTDVPGLSFKTRKSSFLRSFSNIINNSIEAITGEGCIEILLEENERSLLVQIKDNGVGIPQKIVGTLGKRGVSYGKIGGSGLGLYQANAFITLAGGRLEVNSGPSTGTILKIELPKS